VITLKPKLYIMTYRSYPYAWIISIRLDLLLQSPIFINIFIIFLWYLLLKFDFRLEFNDFNKIFFLWFKIWKFIYGVFLKIFILLIYLNHFWRIMFWTKKVSFWGETYLHLLNNRIFVERNSENLHCTTFSKLM
jgi:hypothetical protein